MVSVYSTYPVRPYRGVLSHWRLQHIDEDKAIKTVQNLSVFSGHVNYNGHVYPMSIQIIGYMITGKRLWD